MKSTAVKINDTVQDTVDTVKDKAVDVKDTVQDAANRSNSENQTSNVPDDPATYLLIPVDKQH